VIIPCIR
jgi:hypothetical protein